MTPIFGSDPNCWRPLSDYSPKFGRVLVLEGSCQDRSVYRPFEYLEAQTEVSYRSYSDTREADDGLLK